MLRLHQSQRRRSRPCGCGRRTLVCPTSPPPRRHNPPGCLKNRHRMRVHDSISFRRNFALDTESIDILLSDHATFCHPPADQRQGRALLAHAQRRPHRILRVQKHRAVSNRTVAIPVLLQRAPTAPSLGRQNATHRTAMKTQPSSSPSPPPTWNRNSTGIAASRPRIPLCIKVNARGGASPAVL